MHDLIHVLHLRTDKRSECGSETGHACLPVTFEIGPSDPGEVARKRLVEGGEVKLQNKTR